MIELGLFHAAMTATAGSLDSAVEGNPAGTVTARRR
jgi:hypothetical protein